MTSRCRMVRPRSKSSRPRHPPISDQVEPETDTLVNMMKDMMKDMETGDALNDSGKQDDGTQSGANCDSPYQGLTYRGHQNEHTNITRPAYQRSGNSYVEPLPVDRRLLSESYLHAPILVRTSYSDTSMGPPSPYKSPVISKYTHRSRKKLRRRQTSPVKIVQKGWVQMNKAQMLRKESLRTKAQSPKLENATTYGTAVKEDTKLLEFEVIRTGDTAAARKAAVFARLATPKTRPTEHKERKIKPKPPTQTFLTQGAAKQSILSSMKQSNTPVNIQKQRVDEYQIIEASDVQTTPDVTVTNQKPDIQHYPRPMPRRLHHRHRRNKFVPGALSTIDEVDERTDLDTQLNKTAPLKMAVKYRVIGSPDRWISLKGKIFKSPDYYASKHEVKRCRSPEPCASPMASNLRVTPDRFAKQESKSYKSPYRLNTRATKCSRSPDSYATHAANRTVRSNSPDQFAKAAPSLANCINRLSQTRLTTTLDAVADIQHVQQLKETRCIDKTYKSVKDSVSPSASALEQSIKACRALIESYKECSASKQLFDKECRAADESPKECRASKLSTKECRTSKLSLKECRGSKLSPKECRVSDQSSKACRISKRSHKECKASDQSPNESRASEQSCRIPKKSPKACRTPNKLPKRCRAPNQLFAKSLKSSTCNNTTEASLIDKTPLRAKIKPILRKQDRAKPTIDASQEEEGVGHYLDEPSKPVPPTEPLQSRADIVVARPCATEQQTGRKSSFSTRNGPVASTEQTRSTSTTPTLSITDLGVETSSATVQQTGRTSSFPIVNGSGPPTEHTLSSSATQMQSRTGMVVATPSANMQQTGWMSPYPIRSCLKSDLTQQLPNKDTIPHPNMVEANEAWTTKPRQAHVAFNLPKPYQHNDNAATSASYYASQPTFRNTGSHPNGAPASITNVELSSSALSDNYHLESTAPGNNSSFPSHTLSMTPYQPTIHDCENKRLADKIIKEVKNTAAKCGVKYDPTPATILPSRRARVSHYEYASWQRSLTK